MELSDRGPKVHSAVDCPGNTASELLGLVEREARCLPAFAGPDLPGSSELRARLEEAGAWTDPTRSNRMLRAVTRHRILVMSDKHKLPRAIPCSFMQHLGREVVRQVADPREMSGCPPTMTA
jgi:hypothetical protein